ncbi:MAG: type IIL restriction-modification enzyme MmeI [Peptostreptococcaceae bacterium]
MNATKPNPEIFMLKDLDKKYQLLNLLTDTADKNIEKEKEMSLKAGELIGVLYKALLKKYINPKDLDSLHSLNIFCVRIVFCLYADDSRLFGRKDQFHDYIRSKNIENVRDSIIKLFEILDTEIKYRDKYIDDNLKAFPYVIWWCIF